MARIVTISDTHNQHAQIKLPDGDILIHSGDATGTATESQVKDFVNWMQTQDFKHKIYVPGNHDIGLEENYEEYSQWFKDAGITILNEESTTLEGLSLYDFEEYNLKVYGSPITPNFGRWAFMRARGEQINKHWQLIPEDTDILITHGPPKFILDGIPGFMGEKEHAGCEMLATKVVEVAPKLHIFGHIHEGHGQAHKSGTHYINAAQCNEWNKLVHQPIVVDLK